MATWRCQQCGTPQAESSRCWVCSRSPMTCSTCRNFRAGVVAHIGFCALDRNREPLTGDEIRACWQPPMQPEPVAGLFAMVEALQAAEATGAVGGRLAPGALAPGAPAPGGGATTTGAQAATVAVAGSWYRPVAWIPDEPQAAGHHLPTESLLPAAVARVRDRRRRGRAAAPANARQEVAAPSGDGRQVGRLLEAPMVAPTLRLGSRGDARSLREAAGSNDIAAPAVPDAHGQGAAGPSADGEGLGRLEGGTVL